MTTPRIWIIIEKYWTQYIGKIYTAYFPLGAGVWVFRLVRRTVSY